MRDTRQLNSLKQSRTIIGDGIPDKKDGVDGDFRLNNTPNGVKLYAKFAGQWFGFSPDSDDNTNTNRKFWALHGGIDDVPSTSGENFWCVNDYSGRSVGNPPLTTDFQACAFLAPFNGRVLSMSYRNIRSLVNAPGVTSLNVYKKLDGDLTVPGSDDLLESHTINAKNAITSSADFIQANFEKGNMLFFSSDATNTPEELIFSILFEITN